MSATRPQFPERAVVTAGMPYGNKELHFGHIGGVFVQADIYARFLRDRIGFDNVLFVSGTDCFGATIEASYEQEVTGGFEGSLIDFVARNHETQKATLASYQISPNLYAASALGRAGEIHAALSAEIFRRLHQKGMLTLSRTMQFFDEDRGVFLNGRQVKGRCPIQGCKSETAYADECSLGHQYSPGELIAPVSVLSGMTPAMLPVDNWFFDLPSFSSKLETVVSEWEGDADRRRNLTTIIREFLKKPSIYVKKECVDEVGALPGMPSFSILKEENKTSLALVFDDLPAREKAEIVLRDNKIRFRTGKTLTPFRLSGNVAWGIPVPEAEGVSGLTFWVWPESLWAPISFCKAYLDDGTTGDSWESWWKSPDARVYQFIGEDNIYFYGIAEMGLFLALDEGYRLPVVIPNHHLLFGKTKASSSAKVKPPNAMDLLDHYTPEQLRLHFMNASLGERSVGFEPLAAMRGDRGGSGGGAGVGGGGYDSVLYEGNLATNVFNRLVRSCFYTVWKHNDGVYPRGAVSPEVLQAAERTILEYERLMATFSFDRIFELLNIYLREANKDWSARSKSQDKEEISSLLTDSFHAVRVACTLFHPVTPQGCEMIRDYLGVDGRLWDWAYIFRELDFFLLPGHKFRFLEPRVDFFPKHPTQRG